jgi:hypothetical protein
LTSFPLVSSVVPEVGTVVGERLLYLPSISIVWIAVSFFSPSRTRAAPLLYLVLVALGTYRTVLRVDDWRSSDHLTMVDGKNNVRSSKTQFNLG